MLILTQLVRGILLPAIAAALAIPLARRWAGGRASAGIAVALGYATGEVALRGIGPFPPVEASQWLPYLALAAAVIGTFGADTGGSRWLARRLLGSGLLCVELLLLLRARLSYGWSAAEGAGWLCGLALAAIGLWIGLERVLTRAPRPSGWTVLAVVAGGLAASISASGSLLLGLLGAALCAACAGAGLAAIPSGIALDRRSSTVPAVILVGLLVTAHFYSELPTPSALLLCAAPLAPRLVPTSFVERRGPWIGTVVQALAAGVPALAAVALAIAASPPVESYY